MEILKPQTLEDLNKILCGNRLYANGKNKKVDHFYETVANSKWSLENLWGIYLAKPEYVWMALWMAVTSREKLKKRQIRYILPKEGDCIGSVEIYNPDKLNLDDIFSKEAYLYLFELDKYQDVEIVDLYKDPNLIDDFFSVEKVEKRGVVQDCFVPKFKNKAVIVFDSWQVALTNFEKIIPDKEIVLTDNLIKELSNRVTFVDTEIGKNYIKPFQIKRVLFDLDGTLWDTQKFHASAEIELMREHGVSVSDEEISAKYAGRPTEKVFMEVLGCDEAMALSLSKRKWDKIFPLATHAKELCQIRDLFLALKQRGIAISIGTASPARWAKDLLQTHILEGLIEETDIIGGDMVESGKPSPDIWLRAAKNTPLVNCLVVEDGLAGIEAAVTAGIPCALILPKKHPKAFQIFSASDILDFI
ncbi:MAG: HAD family phosphatase [Candidatus Paceibacterota bacterium]